MAIVNMSTLFDKLQEYIDKKIGSAPDEMQELFDEYGLKEVYENLPAINSVANHLVEINVVNAYINDIITCSDNIQYIIAAPQAAQTAIQKAAEAAQSASEAEVSKNNAYLWSSENEDVPVDDGVHQGYSAYHWAQKALAVDPELYYWRDGSRPITDDFHANNYNLKYVADSVDDTDATNRRESVLVDGSNTMYGSLVVDTTSKDLTTRVFGDGWTSEQWKDKFQITDVNGDTYSLVGDETTTQLRLKVNNISSMSISEGKPPSSQFSPSSDNELTRKDYVDTKVAKSGDTMTGNLTFSEDNEGIQLYDGAAVYKRSGTGLVLKAATNDIVQIETVGGTLYDVLHTGNTVIDDYFTKNDHIDISTGTPDAGKPIILDGNGMIDASMVPMESGWTNQGYFTPTSGSEYPDTTGLPSGSFWSVTGVDDTNGYTFTSGDLSGQVVYNGNLMIWSGGAWSIRVTDLNPFEYYKLDGSQALTADFAGGGFKLTNIAPATQAGEAVEYSQIATFATDFMKLDGTTPMQGDIDMAGNNVVNLSNGVNDTDGVNMLQLNAKADTTYVDSENAVQDTAIANAQTSADNAQADIDSHSANTANPHSVTTSQIGAEPDLGLGTAGQLLATNATADGKEWVDAPNSAIWGLITGDINTQTDLQDEFLNKEDTAGDTMAGPVTAPRFITPMTQNSFTVAAGENAIVGGFEIPDGQTITIEDGGRLIIV